MHRLPSISISLLLVLALPGVALAQDPSGLDQYQPGAPSPTGEPPTGGGTGGGGSSSGTGALSGDPGASATTASGTGTAATAGTATGTGTTASGAPTEAAAAAAGTPASTAGGQLPATGSKTFLLALLGAALVVGGLMLRRLPPARS